MERTRHSGVVRGTTSSAAEMGRTCCAEGPVETSSMAEMETIPSSSLPPCEVKSGEIIDGGQGVDRIESPLTRAQLEQRGVIIRDIEEVVMTAIRADAECIEP